MRLDPLVAGWTGVQYAPGVKDINGSGQSSKADDERLAWLIGQGSPSMSVRRPSRTRYAIALATFCALLVGLFAFYRADHHESQDLQEQLAKSRAMQAMLDAPFAPGSLRDLTPQEARNWNSKAPVGVKEISSATAFVTNARNPGDTMRSLDCLTAAIYYEAGRESVDGRRAVAQVILNRVRHPAFPATVCGVVFQGAERRTGCQFTFTCDGSLKRIPSTIGWAQARSIAEQALSGSVFAPVGWATHYHADYVVPYWASSLSKVGQIGAHIFYS